MKKLVILLFSLGGIIAMLAGKPTNDVVFSRSAKVMRSSNGDIEILQYTGRADTALYLDTTFFVPVYKFADDNSGEFLGTLIDSIASVDGYAAHCIKPTSTNSNNAGLKNGLYIYAVDFTDKIRSLSGVLLTPDGNIVYILDDNDDSVKNNHIVKTDMSIRYTEAKTDRIMSDPDVGRIVSIVETEPDGKVEVYRLYSGKTRMQDAYFLRNRTAFNWIIPWYTANGYSPTLEYLGQPEWQ